MPKEFKGMAKYDRLEAGEFRFMRHDVAYGDNGIEGLLHLVPLSANGFVFTVGSGLPLGAYRFDGEDARTPLRVTGDASAAEAHLYQRFQLPLDWGSWTTLPFEIQTYRSSNLISAMNATWLDALGNADPTFAGVNIRPSVEDTWERFQLSPPSGTVIRGDYATLKVVVTFSAGAGAEYAELADWSLVYRSGKGNV